VKGLTFVDTNVLVYEWDPLTEPKKQRAAEWMRALWTSGKGRLSFQVLTEFYVTATQKLDPVLDRAAARGYVRALLAWQPLAIDAAIVDGAWRAQDTFRLSWWDALIVATAHQAQCPVLLTEDLQDGRSYGGVTVVNPFRVAPDELS
jgi:predicted nucleic acid-binding protein